MLEVSLLDGLLRVVQTERSDGDAAAQWRDARRLGWQLPAVWVDQVHGSAVAEARYVRGPAAADALVRRREDALVVGIRTADCVPVAVATATGDAVVIHAGWPGIVGGVVSSALRALGGEGAVAVIGPHARVCCYEFRGPAREAVSARLGARYFVDDALDLTRAVIDQLREGGVDEVIDLGGCTMHDGRWYSWRRDRSAARQALLVGPGG